MPLPAAIENADVEPKPRRLDGKRAFVTGAARGIGRAVAEALAREGATVCVHARAEAKLKDCLDGLKKRGRPGVPVTADLMKPDEIERMCAAVLSELGGIDVVVNNAGVAAQVDVTEMDLETWNWTLDTNLRAPFLVTRFLLPTIIKQNQGGSLVYNASSAAKQGDPGRSAYNASKAGLVGFVRCVAAEVGVHGINANSVCAGWIATEMAVELHEEIAKQTGQDFDALYQESMRVNAMRALIPPSDVAELMVYLATPAARYITGQAINICGGKTMT
ncbi:MAG: SDR family NAD(P)-dependent oxidoreductase [Alphaproteobacteria bacterium]